MTNDFGKLVPQQPVRRARLDRAETFAEAHHPADARQALGAEAEVDHDQIRIRRKIDGHFRGLDHDNGLPDVYNDNMSCIVYDVNI